MKIRATAIFLLLSISMATAFADIVAAPVKPVVTLKRDAVSASEQFTLADIATIDATPAVLAKLSIVPIGRSPIDGDTRTIGRGDVILRLRVAGFDPSLYTITGSEKVTITLSTIPPAQNGVTTASSMGASGQTTPGAAPAASTNAAIATVRQIKLKAGDPVNVTYDDGVVMVSIAGTLVSGATVGDRVSVRTSISTKTITGILIDAQTVKY
jgi:hypothetical protein